MRIPTLPILLALVACSGTKTEAPVAAETAPAGSTPRPIDIESSEAEGLVMYLSEAQGMDGNTYVATPSTYGEPLSEAETQRLLARAERLESEEGDRATFKKRSSSRKAPRTGVTNVSTFPPEGAGPPAVEIPDGPARVLRYSPDADVPIADKISITFDRPMVSVSSQEVAAETVPVTLAPQPAGRWRWLGTKTLVFDAEPRLPMATTYTVTLDPDARTATGEPVEDLDPWSFATPPPTLKQMTPSGERVTLRPVIALLFDQDVLPEAALAATSLEGGGSPSLRLATDAEIAEDEGARRLKAQELPDDRRVYLVPETDLTPDTRYTLSVGAGLTSAEGPNATQRSQTHGFSTFPPLEKIEEECGWRGECRPGMQWQIRFNNPIDVEDFDPESLTIEPAVDMQIAVYGGQIVLNGLVPGSTTYTVTVPASLTDQFGQTLGTDAISTFKVGKAEPSFELPYRGMTILDPDAKKRGVRIFTVNQPHVDVVVRRVVPEDWPKFEERGRDDWSPPGEIVHRERIDIDGQADARVETFVPLESHLDKGRGNLMVSFEPAKRRKWEKQPHYMWAQATSIAIDAMEDGERLYAFVNDLSTGAPVTDAEIRLFPAKKPLATDTDGRSTFPLFERSDRRPRMLIATRGPDTAFLPPHNSRYGWYQAERTPSQRWVVFDDRGLYKPGETAHIKGFVREYRYGSTGDIHPSPLNTKTARWTVQDPRGSRIAEGEVVLTDHGGFEFDVALPDDVNLGNAYVRIECQDASASKTLVINEFRRPEFEVTSAFDTGPHLLGTRAKATVSANYFSGGALPGAQVQHQATSSPGHFAPPNHEEFAFGGFSPWWWRDFTPGISGPVATLETTTDSIGESQVELHFASMNPARPTTVQLHSTVYDVNRQSWTATTSTVVHPSRYYVGLDASASFVRKGETLSIDAVVADIDGRRIPEQPVSIDLIKMSSSWEKGRWTTNEETLETCEVLSASEATTCRFKPTEGGSYKIFATVVDPEGRPNTTELRTWVSGGRSYASNRVELETVLMVPDAESYAVGDTAEIFLQAPFEDGTATVSWRREGLLHQETVTFEGSTAIATVPIVDAHTPNLHVQVELVGRTARLDDDGNPSGATRVAYASGTLELRVPPLHRTLQVTATPADEALQPGAKTSVDITVQDARGEAVTDAEVVLMVVDESVLALTGYTLVDPMALYYPNRSPGVSDHRMRGRVVLADPNLAERNFGSSGGRGASSKRVMLSAGSAPPPEAASVAMEEMAMDAVGYLDGGGESAQANAPAIAVRSNFDPLAHFAGALTTDANGKATAEIELPDNLTRYRVMVLAADDAQQFGSAEAAITARNALSVRPSAPRFLNFGDRFEMPYVLQNQTEEPLSVQLASAATNAFFLTDLDQEGDPFDIGTSTTGRTVTVPANDRIEVRLPMAADMAGTARLQAVVASGPDGDAAKLELPVYTPATSEAFATYGVIDEGAILQPVTTPSDVWTQFGGLEVTTSSTSLQAVTDAVVQLTTYPYACNEQLSSQILAVAALRDVLSAFEADGLPSQEVLEERVQSHLAKLQERQHRNGGFGFWDHRSRVYPHLSIHVAHAIIRAEQKGFEVPERLKQRSLEYLRNVPNNIPSRYGTAERQRLHAYALYVRNLYGEPDGKGAIALYRAAGENQMPLEALGWLLPTIHDRDPALAGRIRDHVWRQITETAGAANFVTQTTDQERYVLLASNRRVDAVLLDALIEVDPDHDLIPKLVKGLLAHRKRGHWGSTQENAFALLAMDRYFRTYENVEPDFKARVWLGEDFAGEAAFEGRQTKYERIDVPMGYVSEAPRHDLVVEKDGPGRLYYRIAMNYAPRDLKLEPADYGFAVERLYEAVDDESDVRRDADGTWRIRAGAKVRVRLSMVAESRRYHVALVDNLPAGFEPVNPSLRGSGPLPEDPVADTNWWWTRTWYEHDNLRDERVEAFASLLWHGVHEYDYVARATTPGVFVAPPAKAEEMYSPEVFGRSGTERVIIE